MMSHHLTSPHIMIRWGVTDSALVAKLNVALRLWEHLKSRQTTSEVATITKKVWADMELTHYLEEDHTDSNVILLIK